MDVCILSGLRDVGDISKAAPTVEEHVSIPEAGSVDTVGKLSPGVEEETVLEDEPAISTTKLDVDECGVRSVGLHHKDAVLKHRPRWVYVITELEQGAVSHCGPIATEEAILEVTLVIVKVEQVVGSFVHGCCVLPQEVTVDPGVPPT